MREPMNQLLAAALDHMSTGVVIMTADCTFLYANLTASEMIEAGWPIRNVNGIVQGRERHVTDSLLAGAKHVAGDPQRLDPDTRFDICLSCSSGNKEAILGSLKPVLREPRTDYGDAAVSLYLTSRPPVVHAALSCIASTFGLTAAETRIVGALEIYGAVPAVALALALSENTVKTHLQSIFTKTGTARQTQLLRMVSGLRPPLRVKDGHIAAFEAKLSKRKTRTPPVIASGIPPLPAIESPLIYA